MCFIYIGSFNNNLLFLDEIIPKVKTKTELYRACQQFIEEKSLNIEGLMRSYQQDLDSESKSSAGDKHETGRAMLHLEMEKASQQYAVIQKMKSLLEKIDLTKPHVQVKLGSLVMTDGGHFFISISAGSIRVEGLEYYAVSPSSPVGALLLGEQKGSCVQLGEKKITILQVV